MDIQKKRFRTGQAEYGSQFDTCRQKRMAADGFTRQKLQGGLGPRCRFGPDGDPVQYLCRFRFAVADGFLEPVNRQNVVGFVFAPVSPCVQTAFILRPGVPQIGGDFEITLGICHIPL